MYVSARLSNVDRARGLEIDSWWACDPWGRIGMDVTGGRMLGLVSRSSDSVSVFRRGRPV